MSTFVSVGNATQPFPRLLNEVARIARSLPQPVIVQHGATPFHADGCEARPFLQMDEFEALVGAAELLIFHAGSGSVIHAIRAGKVPVVMPRRPSFDEHVDRHQLEFAEELGRAGKVIVAMEKTELEDAVRRALSLQRTAGKTKSGSMMLKLIDEVLNTYARKFG